jgi:tRNA A-37 threonylcarbamoyl transferase component Bud32
MNRYDVFRTVGEGAFGSVKLAKNKQTGEQVAIKHIKKRYATWDEALKLRELKALKQLKKHENVVQLKELVRENEQLYFVFEYMESDLLKHMTAKQGAFSNDEVRSIMYQTLLSLVHCHKNGFFHRDIKPENMLMTGTVVKLADFGCAREIRSRPPFTEYVSTRWYRAPELLLRGQVYSSPVDMWACGCIMAELYNKKNLFPGKSDIDTLYKVVNVLGTPNHNTWAEGMNLAAQSNFKFPQSTGQSLGELHPSAEADALHLLSDLLKYDSNKRPTAAKALQYPFFTNHPPPQPYLVPGQPLPMKAAKVAPGPCSVFSVGQRVEARYGGREKYYGGSVVADGGNGRYSIKYDDGDQEVGVDASLIRAPAPGNGAPPPEAAAMGGGGGGGGGVFSVGQRVEARYGGKPQFYGGRIEAKRPDGTYSIIYDDGDSEVAVQPDFIRGVGGGPSGGMGGMGLGQAGAAVAAMAMNLPPGGGAAPPQYPTPGGPGGSNYSSPTKVDPGGGGGGGGAPGSGGGNPHRYRPGQRVEARFGGKQRFFSATVAQCRYDGSVDLAYDDGDKEMGVRPHLIRRAAQPQSFHPSPEGGGHAASFGSGRQSGRMSGRVRTGGSDVLKSARSKGEAMSGLGGAGSYKYSRSEQAVPVVAVVNPATHYSDQKGGQFAQANGVPDYSHY